MLLTTSAVISNPDPFTLVEDAGAPGNRGAITKALFTGSLAGACVLLIAGQSNVCNSFPTPYTPSNTNAVYNFNVYDGATYNAADPLLGCSIDTAAGNFAGRLADKLITAGLFSKVLLVPVGIDGTQVSQWTSGANFGSRVTVALRRLSARGLSVTAALWGQGESDHGTAQATYQTSLGTVITNSRADGYNGPWFIAKQTLLANAIDSTVQAAQVAMVNHGSGIWAGPDADTLTGGTNRTDGTHFTDVGADAYAGLWQTALHAFGAPF